jgi:hypothetical protein
MILLVPVTADTLTQVIDGWSTIPAPVRVAYLVLSCGVASFAWWLGRHLLSARIAVLKERLALSEAKRAAGDGADLAAIQPRLESLGEQVLSLLPRRLDEDQRTRLIAALKAGTGKVAVTHNEMCPDARIFAADIGSCFKDAGWDVQVHSIARVRVHGHRGITVEMGDPLSLTTPQSVAIGAMNGARIPYDVRSTVLRHTDGFVPDIELIVTHKDANVDTP